MNVKMTLVLLGVLILLVVAIIAIQEPDRGPRTDPRLVPDFAADDVTELSWSLLDREVVLRRGEDGGDDSWTVLVSGQEVPASPVEIKEVLNDIDRCRIRKRLPADGVDAQSRHNYGLDPAVTRLTIELRGEKREYLLGVPGIGRDTTYAQGPDGRDVLIVDNDLMTQISGLEASALRARRLFDWSVYRVVEFEITDADGVRLKAARKADDKDFWVATAPFSGDLDPEAVESRLLPAILNMEAEEFTADDVAEDGFAEYGLDAPRYSIRVKNEDGVERTIRLGGPRPDGEMGFFYMEEGRPFVYAAGTEIVVDELAVDPVDMRERHVSRLGYQPVGRAVGRLGEEAFEIVREGDAWQIEKPSRMTADMESVDGWLASLREVVAERFLDDPDLEALGFGEPSGELAFWGPGKHDHDLPDEPGPLVERLVIYSGSESNPGTWVMREGARGTLYGVGPVFASLVSRGFWQFRSKEILVGDIDGWEAVGIARARGDEVLDLTAVDGKWPEGTDANVVNSVVSTLLSLRANRWVGPAEGNEEKYDLGDSPEMSVSVAFKNSQEADSDETVLGLIIGAALPGGRYARLVRGDVPEPGVFVLGEIPFRRLSQSPKKADDGPDDGGPKDEGGGDREEETPEKSGGPDEGDEPK